MDVEELVQHIRPLVDRAVVATDFDGTLAPLTADPESSRPVDGAVAALAALAGRGAKAAVITGRDARTVVRLGGFEAVPGVVVEGLYGLEQWHDGRLDTPDAPAELHELRDRLPQLLEDTGADPEVWIEDKRLSLVVHTRRAADPQREFDALREPIGRLAETLGLEAHPGSRVWELRLPGYDKAGAIDRLVERFAPAALLYLGDDIGDLPAFARVRELRRDGLAAYSVGVLSSGVDDVAGAVDVALDDAHAAVTLLRRLAE